MADRLILFDIDGTLFAGGGAGFAAFIAAGRTLYGDRFANHRLNPSGRLDPWIMRELVRMNAIHDFDDDAAARFRHLCHAGLREAIGSGRHEVRALAGGADLVAALEAESDITLGLLTGNWAENGRLKIESVGFDPDRFEVCVWGDDAEERVGLPPIGRSRFRDLRGREIGFESITIIGDTEHDVTCGRTHGCRVLAVATGRYGVEDLAAHGPDRVVADLTDTEDLLRWILDGAGAPA